MRHWGPPSGGWQHRNSIENGWSRKPSRHGWLAPTQNAPQTGSSSTSQDDDPKSKLQRTEAVLILSRGSLTTRKLATLAGLADATEARTLIRQLNQLYDDNRRAFRVEEVAGGFELLTRPQFAPYLRRLGHVPQAIRLSSPAMETLAIVAYRQPVMRADIEAVRGVQSGELLRQLMERDLVRISGRSEELGRPYLYSTTKRFLQVFGLRSTEALPCADWFNEPNSQENEGSDPESSQKESDVSITIASDLMTAQESEAPLNEAPASASAIVAPAPKAIDDDEWDEEGDDWDDDDEEEEDADADADPDEDWDEESDDDWDEEEDGADEEYDDEDEDEDGDWEEVDDEESDEEWDDSEDESEDVDDSEEEDSEWVDDEDDDDWDDEDEGEF